jgi:hypothetical protein
MLNKSDLSDSGQQKQLTMCPAGCVFSSNYPRIVFIIGFQSCWEAGSSPSGSEDAGKPNSMNAPEGQVVNQQQGQRIGGMISRVDVRRFRRASRRSRMLIVLNKGGFHISR